ncbi:MAG: diaminopimelate dehydrogenase, partial [Clostridia bacterium]|nr:diaminopimelate dehydrogenase [Clostridia bacterium]
MAIRVGIYGYGNLGRGVEIALTKCPDMTLCGVFTRRDPSSLTIRTEGVPVVAADQAAAYADKIDVMILCGGSATDLPTQTPAMASLFTVVDSFDTPAKIPAHLAAVDAAAKAAGKVGAISVGWDPGMFSLNRLYAGAVLPDGKDYTFWGRGV